MSDRLEVLEGKVDAFSGLFTEVITNQKLMHQEIALMNKTVRQIEGIKLSQVECRVDTHGRLRCLEDNANEVKNKFKFRDRLTIGGAIAIIGYLFKLAIGV